MSLKTDSFFDHLESGKDSIHMKGEKLGQARFPTNISPESNRKTSIDYFLAVYENCLDLFGILNHFSEEVPRTVVGKEHAFFYRFYRKGLCALPEIGAHISGPAPEKSNLRCEALPFENGRFCLVIGDATNSARIVLPRQLAELIVNNIIEYWPEVAELEDL